MNETEKDKEGEKRDSNIEPKPKPKVKISTVNLLTDSEKLKKKIFVGFKRLFTEKKRIEKAQRELELKLSWDNRSPKYSNMDEDDSQNSNKDLMGNLHSFQNEG